MPNERLIEEELVRFLGANRMQVRNALARLEQDGLVSSQPNRGARVRLVSEHEAIEIMQCRAALEVLVSREAASKATAADRTAIQTIMVEMRTKFDAGDLLGYSDVNSRLHATITGIADNKTAAKLLATLKSQSIRFQYRAILLSGRAAASLAEHEALAQAVCANDLDGAERAARIHLSHVVEALGRAIEASKQRAGL